MRCLLVAALTLSFPLACAARAPAPPQLNAQSINDAQWNADATKAHGALPALVKAQVLLARARFSPGEIDGKDGDNFKKALAAYAAAKGLPASGNLEQPVWQQLTQTSGDPVVAPYILTDDDVKGPFLKKLPARMEAMQDLPALGYTSAREGLAEKFHMSEALLAALNPGQSFAHAGQSILVVKAATDPLPDKVARIVVDKRAQSLSAFDHDQHLLAFYPITAGSAEKPAPSGRLKVMEVSRNPTYRYNPAYAFKGVKTKQPFTIKPGPNNPVGLVWIGLSDQGYGIHGTPEPAKIGKSESHGCVRLTNWDALQLAAATSKGVPVDFGDEDHTSAR